MNLVAINDLQPASIKLSQLVFDLEHNSRQGLDEPAMQELVKSIEANGLITPLTVRPTKISGTYLVIDGHRRLEALNRLYGEKAEATHVPVLVRTADDADARALSLAANIVRLPLHPADQYQAFAAMLDEGMDKEQIASRFNLAGKDVERVLALGRVIPAALNHYRAGKIDADTIKLFSGCSEERQLAVWKKAYEDDSLTRWQVQRLLTDDTISGNTPVARLVTEERYEAAGGRIERSLFNEATRWLDTELALTLAKQCMGEVREQLEAEGWAFVKVEGDMPKQWRNWGREYATRQLTPEQQARHDEITKRIEEIDEIDADQLTEAEDEALTEERDRIVDEQDEIERSAPYAYSPEQKAGSGVVLMEDYSVVMGVIWLEKVKEPEPGAKPEKPEVKGWSQALIDEINSHGTVAAQLAIMREPDLADCMLLAGMYQDTVHDVVPRVMALNSADRFSDVQINAGSEIQKALKGFGLKGAKFWSLVDQLMDYAPTERDKLRAVLVARAICKRRDKDLEETFEHLQTLDLTATWKPDKGFFERLNVAQLSEVHKELTGFGLVDPTTKKSAVEIVSKKAEAAGWVPKWLRKGLKAGAEVKLPPPKKPKKAAKGDVITTIVGEDGKTASVKRKKAA